MRGVEVEPRLSTLEMLGVLLQSVESILDIFNMNLGH